ncbi:MAG TPA: hypothetical protein VJR89_00785 [Polyangiales bacterium]|nr:hypothetical protein [Polyangiales bacterium]
MTRVSRHLALAFGLFAGSLPEASDAQAGAAKLICEITENAEAASGTVSVQRDGKEIAGGTCGKELSLPPGSYSAVVKLDGALDGPSQTKSLSVEAGSKSVLKVDFATGTLEIRIASQGKRAAGMAIIKKNGVQIGTLGSGVAAHLSAGSYQVTARYRNQEKDLGTVAVSAGQRVSLDAAFE